MSHKLTTLENYTDINGNSLAIGKNISFRSSSVTFKDKNSSIKIHEGSNLDNLEIEVGTNSTLEISSGCRIRGSIAVGYNSRVTIGKNLQVTKNVLLRAVESTTITIGDHCLFASNITIRTTDGHPIYDARTRERINPSVSIVIGNHVWLADDVVILKGVEIGQASVVGVRSVVTKSMPQNSIITGSPAIVVKEGVTWELSPGIFMEEYYVSSQDSPAGN